MKIAIVTGVADLHTEEDNVFVTGLPPYIPLFIKNNKAGIAPPIAQLGEINQ